MFAASNYSFARVVRRVEAGAGELASEFDLRSGLEHAATTNAAKESGTSFHHRADGGAAAVQWNACDAENL